MGASLVEVQHAQNRRLVSRGDASLSFFAAKTTTAMAASAYRRQEDEVAKRLKHSAKLGDVGGMRPRLEEKVVKKGCPAL